MSSRLLALMRLFRAYPRVLRSQNYAQRKGLPGLEFARFSQKMGWQLVLSGNGAGVPLLLRPVVDPRFFEFTFASRYAPRSSSRVLDVSSPFLFSLHYAWHNPGSAIVMINPDKTDAEHVRSLGQSLKLKNLTVDIAKVAAIPDHYGRFDCIWSLSVIEHISGDCDDRQAVRYMFDALRPRGRLILTFPVDRKYWIEYRESDPYGTQQSVGAGRFFYQRWYNRAAIEERIVSAIGQRPAAFAWFGERVPGTFQSFEAERLKGKSEWLWDASRRMADHFQEYNNYDDLPGVGICGLMFEKS